MLRRLLRNSHLWGSDGGGWWGDHAFSIWQIPIDSALSIASPLAPSTFAYSLTLFFSVGSSIGIVGSIYIVDGSQYAGTPTKKRYKSEMLTWSSIKHCKNAGRHNGRRVVEFSYLTGFLPYQPLSSRKKTENPRQEMDEYTEGRSIGKKRKS